MSSNYNRPNCNCGNKLKESKCDNPLCCQGVVPVKFNVGKAKTICAYVDVIFDEKNGTGSPLFDALATTTTTYTSTLALSSPNPNCCTPCTIGDGALFVIDSCVDVEISDVLITAALATTDVQVNGKDVAAVDDLGNGEYLITLGAANILEAPDCDVTDGRKSTLMFDAVGPWSYEAKYNLNGTVNYNGQVCKFKADIETLVADTPTTTDSTIIVQNLCISSTEAKIYVSLDGDISVINPVLTYSSGVLVLTASVVIIPKVKAEVIENKKVCLQAMI